MRGFISAISIPASTRNFSGEGEKIRFRLQDFAANFCIYFILYLLALIYVSKLEVLYRAGFSYAKSAASPRLFLLVRLSSAARERLPTVIGPSYFSITPAMNDSGATVFVANTYSFFIAALS